MEMYNYDQLKYPALLPDPDEKKEPERIDPAVFLTTRRYRAARDGKAFFDRNVKNLVDAGFVRVRDRDTMLMRKTMQVSALVGSEILVDDGYLEADDTVVIDIDLKGMVYFSGNDGHYEEKPVSSSDPIGYATLVTAGLSPHLPENRSNFIALIEQFGDSANLV